MLNDLVAGIAGFQHWPVNVQYGTFGLLFLAIAIAAHRLFGDKNATERLAYDHKFDEPDPIESSVDVVPEGFLAVPANVVREKPVVDIVKYAKIANYYRKQSRRYRLSRSRKVELYRRLGYDLPEIVEGDVVAIFTNG